MQAEARGGRSKPIDPWIKSEYNSRFTEAIAAAAVVKTRLMHQNVELYT